jgi:flagellar basal body-associated protein FliL
MSDKADKKKDAHAEGEGEKKKGGIMALLTKLPVLLGGVMIIEAAVLFGVFKVMSKGPENAEGAELHGKTDGAHGEAGGEHGEGADAVPDQVELLAVEFRAPNKRTGRTFLYDVAIFVSVKGEKMEEAKKLLEQRKALITDRVRTIIAQSDPEKLGGGSEPGLETLRRQVKFQLDEILGEGMIEEVLVPRCIPFRTDF